MIANYCRLSLEFDAARLKRDLVQLSPRDWEAHFNAEYHDGGWFGVALRTVAENFVKLYPEPVPGARYTDTAVLATLPNLAEAIARFECPLQSVRLLRLRAGTSIHEHRDYGLGFDEGTVRLHVPLATGPDVEFYLDGERVTMGEGECWYLDFSLPHRVQNLGREDRIHLVIDCMVNDWLMSLFPTEQEQAAQRHEPRTHAAASRSSQRQLEQFQHLVVSDEALQEKLRYEPDRERFIALVITTGLEVGYRFTENDVKAAMQSNRRAWIERLLVQ